MQRFDDRRIAAGLCHRGNRTAVHQLRTRSGPVDSAKPVDKNTNHAPDTARRMSVRPGPVGVNDLRSTGRDRRRCRARGPSEIGSRDDSVSALCGSTSASGPPLHDSTNPYLVVAVSFSPLFSNPLCDITASCYVCCILQNMNGRIARPSSGSTACCMKIGASSLWNRR